MKAKRVLGMSVKCRRYVAQYLAKLSTWNLSNICEYRCTEYCTILLYIRKTVYTVYGKAAGKFRPIVYREHSEYSERKASTVIEVDLTRIKLFSALSCLVFSRLRGSVFYSVKQTKVDRAQKSRLSRLLFNFEKIITIITCKNNLVNVIFSFIASSSYFV